MRQNRHILTFLALFQAFSLFSQTNKERFLEMLKQDSIQQDSLRKVFYQEPKFIHWEFEFNGKVKTPDQLEKYLFINNNQVKLNVDKDGKSFLDYSIDTIQKLTLQVKYRRTILTQEIEPIEMRNGANIKVGLITDIYKRKRRGLIKTQSEDCSLSESEEFYNQLTTDTIIDFHIKNKTLKHIQFFQVSPRVYGCGTTTKYVAYNNERKNNR